MELPPPQITELSNLEEFQKAIDALSRAVDEAMIRGADQPSASRPDCMETKRAGKIHASLLRF